MWVAWKQWEDDGKADERRFLLTFVSIIGLAVLFTALAHAWPEIMPWHRPDARHIR